MYRVPAVTQLGGERPPVRLYQTWKGNNIFILQGRLVFGPDVRSLFLTIGLIVVPMSIFCAFVARKLMDAFADHGGVAIMVVAVVLTLIDLTFLLLTCARDPGIIPRNAHPPELEPSTDLGSGQTSHSRLPRTIEARVNGIIVKVKYCDTCMLYRPPRCSHCSICNNCVENFDHHCPWVGQCIGLRNYRFFFTFILSTALLCSYVLALCWVDIKRTMDTEHRTIWKAMARTPASVALILYTFVPFFFVAGLSLFHVYLISTNQTTYENFRYQYDRRVNPYNRGFVNNIKEKFFSGIPPSKNDFRSRVVREISLSNRMTEGDFVSPTLGRPDGELEMGRKATWSEDSSGLMFNDLESEAPTESSGAKESGTCKRSRNLTTS